MKYVFTLFLMLLVSSTANAAGTFVSYEVNGKPYEGYFVSPSPPTC
jgi:hypothetical protein